MTIQSIEISNFKAYAGHHLINCDVTESANIILFGGLNGHGKTTLLLSLVWCLYGKRIDMIDDVYRREVKGGYGEFLGRCINRESLRDGSGACWVSLTLDDVFRYDASISGNPPVTLTRTYDSRTKEESFEIHIRATGIENVSDDEQKNRFVDEYIIPIDAAKFVFFDAEKISDIAEMSVKEQGRIMSDALERIIGLDVYNRLRLDLLNAKKTLKQECAPSTLNVQIVSRQSALSAYENEKLEIQTSMDEAYANLHAAKGKIETYAGYLSDYASDEVSMGTHHLIEQRRAEEERVAMIDSRMQGITDLLPFIVASESLLQMRDEIEKYVESQEYRRRLVSYTRMGDELIERLFNDPPFPADGDISFRQKMFYADKALLLMKDIVDSEDNPGIGTIDYDLSGHETEHITSVVQYIQQVNHKAYIDDLRQQLESLKKIDALNEQLATLRDMNQDELIVEYRDKLSNEERERDRSNQLLGELSARKQMIEENISDLHSKIEALLNTIKASDRIKGSITTAESYIQVVEQFVMEQTAERCKDIARTTLQEMKKLMHKGDLISDVEVKILPDDFGLQVILRNDASEIVNQESISSGEQQLFVSCLLKGILAQAMKRYPVVIDTPLARLDLQHKDSMLRRYYPELSHQVILLATNSELPVHKVDDIRSNIAHMYTIRNSQSRSAIELGYFEYGIHD